MRNAAHRRVINEYITTDNISSRWCAALLIQSENAAHRFRFLYVLRTTLLAANLYFCHFYLLLYVNKSIFHCIALSSSRCQWMHVPVIEEHSILRADDRAFMCFMLELAGSHTKTFRHVLIMAIRHRSDFRNFAYEIMKSCAVCLAAMASSFDVVWIIEEPQ